MVKIISDEKKLKAMKNSLPKNDWECPCKIKARTFKGRFKNKCFCEDLRISNKCTCKLFVETDVLPTDEDLIREAEFFAWMMGRQFGNEFVKIDKNNAGVVYLADFLCLYLTETLGVEQIDTDVQKAMYNLLVKDKTNESNLEPSIIKYNNLLIIKYDMQLIANEEIIKSVEVEEDEL